MDVRSIVLSAGVAVRQEIPFRFFLLIAAPTALDVTFLKPGSLSKTGEIGRSVEAGYKLRPLNPADPKESWGGFELLSAVDQTVRVGTSLSEGDYARLVQVFQLDPPTDLKPTQDVTDIGGTAPVAIIAANGDAVTRHVTALSSNTSNLRIGNADVDTDKGQPLQPGLTFSTSVNGALYAIREDGSATADHGVAIVEEQRT